MVFADELAMHLWPKVGRAWMAHGTPQAVMAPGPHQKHSLAGALDWATGTRHHCLGARHTTVLGRDVLGSLDERYPVGPYRRLDGVVDNAKLHNARAVEPWLAVPPRGTLLLLPTYCPRANPSACAFGDVHDSCTRNHRRPRLPALVAAVEDHVHLTGPWTYKWSDLSYEPAVTAAVEKRSAQEHAEAVA
jgi:hypothetical protein